MVFKARVLRSLYELLFGLIFGVPVSAVFGGVLYFFAKVLFVIDSASFVDAWRWSYFFYMGLALIASVIIPFLFLYPLAFWYSKKWKLPFKDVEEGVVRYGLLPHRLATADRFLETLSFCRDPISTVFNRLIRQGADSLDESAKNVIN